MLTKTQLEEHVNCDQIVVRSGQATFRRAFFYRQGRLALDFLAQVKRELDDAGVRYRLADWGEVWKPFRGGASISQQSHWFVKVELL